MISISIENNLPWINCDSGCDKNWCSLSYSSSFSLQTILFFSHFDLKKDVKNKKVVIQGINIGVPIFVNMR